jgi:hypothetical protein
VCAKLAFDKVKLEGTFFCVEYCFYQGLTLFFCGWSDKRPLVPMYQAISLEVDVEEMEGGGRKLEDIGSQVTPQHSKAIASGIQTENNNKSHGAYLLMVPGKCRGGQTMVGGRNIGVQSAQTGTAPRGFIDLC